MVSGSLGDIAAVPLWGQRPPHCSAGWVHRHRAEGHSPTAAEGGRGGGGTLLASGDGQHETLAMRAGWRLSQQRRPPSAGGEAVKVPDEVCACVWQPRRDLQRERR